MSPAEIQLQAERVRRWRARPDLMSHRKVDWSPWARRRAGWRDDRGGAERDPNRSGAAWPGPAQGAANGPQIIRVAFIRIDFANDRSGDQSSGNGRFDLSTPTPDAVLIDPPPRNASFYRSHLEALSRYYGAQSYGRVHIEGDVWPPEENSAYTVGDMADFGPWAFTRDIYPQAVEMTRTFLFAADSQAFLRGQAIPWDTYDRVALIHAGSDFQNDVRQDSPSDIPSFTIGLGDSDRVFFHFGAYDTTGLNCDPSDPNTPCFNLDRALIVPETINQDGYLGALNGVIAHECGHLLFGMDDLYNFQTGLPVVGLWSLMDSGNLVGSLVLTVDNSVVPPDTSVVFATGLLPPSVDPWQRFFVGDALYFPEAVVGDTMQIRDSERHPDVSRVTLSSDEYLLLENRYLLPANVVELQADTVTHVVMSPRPDSLLYDALTPGPGVLVWHIDTSVIPFTTSLRVNPDYGYNTNARRPGISVIEADGLADLGDLGSPYLLGAPSDPWFRTVNPVLSDTTIPNLIPHIGTRPHRRLEFLDEPDSVVSVVSSRSWQLAGWPVSANFPPGGPRLLAVDADGDRNLEVCWAGGSDSVFIGGEVAPDPDSAALFAVKVDGSSFYPISGSYAFAHLDRRPRPLMAALPLGEPPGGLGPAVGPCWFAASTYPAGSDTSFAGGRVWLVDTLGEAIPGWPPPLPSIVTTPPVILGSYPNAVVFVGCANDSVYMLGLDGSVMASRGGLSGGVSGRLAVNGTVFGAGQIEALVAAGGLAGDVAVLDFTIGVPRVGAAMRGRSASAGPPPVWVRRVGSTGFAPDFLWLDFGGAAATLGRAPSCGGPPGGPPVPALVVRDVDHLLAFCEQGQMIPGWGRSAGDTLTDALAAGDPDGDGFPEVLTQTVRSKLAFWDASGAPSPGWPVAGTKEDLRTQSPPLAIDVDGDGRCELVGLNGSGVLAAIGANAKAPTGWPLATGAGAAGDVVAADLNRDGTLEVIGPDRFGQLYAYSLPVGSGTPQATPWTMVGGDPGRTSALPVGRTTIAPAASPGPLVSGSLKAYPNPARRRPVSFAYRLTEDAQIEFRILDSSGHEVASFTRTGIQSDNVEVWDPGHLPAGLYLAQLRFRGSGTERTEVLPVGVLR